MKLHRNSSKELNERTFEFVKTLLEEKFDVPSIVRCLTTHASRLGTQSCYSCELPIRDMLLSIASTLDTIAQSKYDDENAQDEEDLEQSEEKEVEKTLH